MMSVGQSEHWLESHVSERSEPAVLNQKLQSIEHFYIMCRQNKSWHMSKTALDAIRWYLSIVFQTTGTWQCFSLTDTFNSVCDQFRTAWNNIIGEQIWKKI
jgi:hypothetical protein